MEWRLSKFLVLLCLVLTACSPEETVAADPVTVNEWLPLRIDAVEVQAQVALTAAEMRKGLMYRESLPPDSGMVFVYRQQHTLTFWMANTPLPLDIAFFDNTGKLLEIRRMYPYDTTRITSSSDQAQFALEMPSGWYSENKLLPGAHLDLDLLELAVRKRGVDPVTLGLSR